jgi:catechol-2,3-dioxygenase
VDVTGYRAILSWLSSGPHFKLVIHDFPTGSAVVVEAVGMPEIMGFSHVDLTVSDCDRAVQWWQEVLGFILVHQVHEAT